MTGAAALREVERRLVSIRSIATQADQLEQYQADMLPEGPVPALLEQGYAAGYGAAVRLVAAALGDVQTQVIREAK